MKQSITKLGAVFTEDQFIRKYPKEEKDKIIKRELVNQITSYILKHLDELPIELSEHNSPFGVEHVLNVLLISQEELNELKEYKNTCEEFSKVRYLHHE